jgi:3-(3-hydroxy-phenyl)propionate hydroxylase
MPSTYRAPEYPYVKPPELAAGGVARTQVAIVGAGPIGLAAAIELALQGIDFIIVDDNNTVSVGSRAICYAKRALEVLDRLGCGEAICTRGVEWKVGKVFFHDQLAYQFDLLPEPGHKRPAFVNLQQYHLEQAMVERLAALGHGVRWKNKAVGIAARADGVQLEIETPDGHYFIESDYAIAADGARSALRDLMGLEWKGQVFRDRFLIADVHMKGDYPTERWFWFDPPFHPGQSVLLHRQADDVWRIDFQLGWDADPDEERKPERVIPRIKAMLGDDRPFELEWVSVYTFQCRRLDRFVHGRVLFVGDAAHQVSPFGARGARAAPRITRIAARQLQRRARRGGRREHPELDARDRLHHAEKRHQPDLPGCGARPVAPASVCATAGQQRALVDADDAPRESVVDSRSGFHPRTDGARRAGGGCADAQGRPRLLAARLHRGTVRPAVV